MRGLQKNIYFIFTESNIKKILKTYLKMSWIWNKSCRIKEVGETEWEKERERKQKRKKKEREIRVSREKKTEKKEK